METVPGPLRVPSVLLLDPLFEAAMPLSVNSNLTGPGWLIGIPRCSNVRLGCCVRVDEPPRVGVVDGRGVGVPVVASRGPTLKADPRFASGCLFRV